MYFVAPCRATIVIRLRIVWSRTVVAYALFLCRAHTLSSCSGVPVHSASVQGCDLCDRRWTRVRFCGLVLRCSPLKTQCLHSASRYSRRMSTKKREVRRRGIQLGSATHIGLFSAPRRAASRNYKGPRRGALKNVRCASRNPTGFRDEIPLSFWCSSVANIPMSNGCLM